eukprot:c33701_g1_i1.p1 GENE.c33701_g1_i1~~c33701_g1_i1.p1  ORF type:complete len:531 (+),score=116.99 c33701_g1_i1:56-1648(+)
MNFCFFVNLTFFLFALISLSDEAYLTICEKDNTDCSSYDAKAPAFALGNLDFPISGEPIWTQGCEGVVSLDNSLRVANATNKIVFLQYNPEDSACFYTHHVFMCQARSWCTGIFVEDYFFNPSGLNMWSVFDKTRPRSDYKVPMVQPTLEEFALFKRLIKDAEMNNKTVTLTLTSDPSKWGELFTSAMFLILFRVLYPVFSFGCFVLAIKLIKKHAEEEKKRLRRMSSSLGSGYNRQKKSFAFFRTKPTLKMVCLVLQAFTHICRVFYFAIDPLFSQQIFPNLASYVMFTSTTAFYIVTNILLAFVIRELTQAKQFIDVMTKIKIAYVIILCFLFLDYSTTILAGLVIRVGSTSTWLVKVVFYVILSIVLGLWYLWEGFKFLRRAHETEKKLKKTDNVAQRIMIQMAMVNSVGIIIFGCLCTLASFRGIYGTPAGYFTAWFSGYGISQITSFIQIFLFGGVLISSKRLSLTRMRSLRTMSVSVNKEKGRNSVNEIRNSLAETTATQNKTTTDMRRSTDDKGRRDDDEISL